jgi:hypothetical protein
MWAVASRCAAPFPSVRPPGAPALAGHQPPLGARTDSVVFFSALLAFC